MNVPWHPPALRLPLENEQFPQWVPLWGEQRHWQKSSAVVCQVLCADLHCSPCVWLSTWYGHNMLTNPQCTWGGVGCVFQQASLRGMVGWKFSWQGSSSCHLNLPFQLNCIFNNPSINNSLICYIILRILKVILHCFSLGCCAGNLELR